MQKYRTLRLSRLAFSFRDTSQEVTCFEQLFGRYAKVGVVRVLELAFGPSPHLRELCQRGYEYYGLDLNEKMLVAGKKKVTDSAWTAQFYQAFRIDFNLDTTFQFVFVALGSLYARNSAELPPISNRWRMSSNLEDFTCWTGAYNSVKRPLFQRTANPG